MNCPPGAVIEVGTVLTGVPPIWMIMEEPAVNPLPRSCTVDRAAPDVGVRIIVGVVNAKVAVAVLPAASVTTTVVVGVAVSGTMKLVATVPPAPVVPAAAVIAAPLTVTVKAVPAVAKPVPAMLAVDPLSPVVCAKVIAAAMVIDVVALLVPSPTVNVYVPPVMPAGTRNQVVKMYALVPVVGTFSELSAASMLVAPIVAAVIG